MPESPQVESPNVLTLDFSDNPKLKEIFAHKDVGHKCKLTFELQVDSKYPEGVKCSIEKIITTGYSDGEEKETEAEPEIDHPIMATMRKKNRTNRGMMGPHNRPPQTAENSAEPWKTAYT